jgi:hypothetical protein
LRRNPDTKKYLPSPRRRRIEAQLNGKKGRKRGRKRETKRGRKRGTKRNRKWRFLKCK